MLNLRDYQNYQNSQKELEKFLQNKTLNYQKEFQKRKLLELAKIKVLKQRFDHEIALYEEKKEILKHRETNLVHKLKLQLINTKQENGQIKKAINKINSVTEKRIALINDYQKKIKFKKEQALETFQSKQTKFLQILEKQYQKGKFRVQKNVARKEKFLQAKFINDKAKYEIVFQKIENKFEQQAKLLENTFSAKEAKIRSLIDQGVFTETEWQRISLQNQEAKQKAYQKLLDKKYLIFNWGLWKNKSCLYFWKATDSQANEKRLSNLVKFINTNKLIFALLIFAIIIGILKPRFFSSQNWLLSILRANVFSGLLALGMTFVILTGSIDLSVGSALGLSATLTLILKGQGYSIALAILLASAIVLFLGLIMGFLVAYANFQPFIVTLIGLLSFSGLSRILLNGRSLSIKETPFFHFLGRTNVGVLPVSVLLFLLLAIVTIITLRYTKFGRYIYATGSNAQAAFASGIRTKVIKMSVFIISAAFVILAALVFLANVGSTSPTTGAGFELDAIAAVVLGGTSLSGGKGGIIKTLIGWLVISILSNTLVFLNVDSNFQLIIRGVVILIAITLDSNLKINHKIKNLFIKIRSIYVLKKKI